MDFDNITLGEIAEIEDYAQLPFSDIALEKVGVIRLRIALAWIIKRREDASYTIAQAEALTTAEMGLLFGNDEQDAVKK